MTAKRSNAKLPERGVESKLESDYRRENKKEKRAAYFLRPVAADPKSGAR